MKFIVIGPKFFNYSESIRLELSRLGYESIFINERVSDGFIIKVLTRLNMLNQSRVENHFQYIRKKIIENKITHAIVLNPETLSSDHLRNIKNILNGNLSIYLWDSFKNKPIFHNYHKNLKSYMTTFDLDDSKNMDINHLPLFHTYEYKPLNENKIYEFSSICTIHSDRINMLKKFKDYSDKNGNAYYFHLYFSSYAQLFLKAMRHPISLFSLRNFLTNKKLTHSQINNIFNKSNYVVDISHAFQSGLTSRTFEALASGAALITTNKSINFYKDIAPKCVYINNKRDLYAQINSRKKALNNSSVTNTNHRIDKWVVKLIKN